MGVNHGIGNREFGRVARGLCFPFALQFHCPPRGGNYVKTPDARFSSPTEYDETAQARFAVHPRVSLRLLHCVIVCGRATQMRKRRRAAHSPLPRKVPEDGNCSGDSCSFEAAEEAADEVLSYRSLTSPRACPPQFSIDRQTPAQQGSRRAMRRASQSSIPRA